MGKNLLAILLIWVMGVSVVHASNIAKFRHKYNNEHPLVYVENNDFPPYCFLDEDKQACGYFVDVITEFSRRVDVPLIIRLKPEKYAKDLYRYEEADFVITKDDVLPGEGHYAKQTLIGHRRVYHIFSKDSILLAVTDSIVGAMKDDGTIANLENKWFYPERVQHSVPTYVFVVGFSCIAFIILLIVFVQLYYRHRLKKLNVQKEQLYQHFREATADHQFRLFIYDLHNDTYSAIHDDGQIEPIARDVHVSDFLKRTADKGREFAADVISGKTDNVTYQLEDESEGQHIVYQVKLRSLDHDVYGKGKMLVIMNDITEKKKKQAEVYHNQLRYEAAFNHSSFAITFFDRNGMITDMNDAAQRLYGFSNVQFKNNPLFSFQNLFEAVELGDDMTQYSMTNIVKVNDYLEDVGDYPSVRYFDTIITPIFDEEHRLSSAFSISRDITQQVEAIHQRKVEMKTVEEMSRRSNIYLAQANETLDHYHMKIVRYYPGRHEMEIHDRFGEVKQVLSGFDCLDMVIPEDRDAVLYFFKALDGLTPDPLHYPIKLKKEGADGKPLVIDFSFVPQFNKDGAVESYVGMAMNVSEGVYADEQIALDAEKAKEAEKTKDAFLENVDHDVRVPLNAIVGNANKLTKDISTEEQKECVDEIQRNSNELLDLVNDVLLYSRIEANLVDIKPMEVDFAQRFEHICLGESQNYQNLHITVDNKYSSFVADIDITNITHAVRMILKQAANHQVESNLRVTYVYTDRELGILIEDHGDSIPMDVVQQYQSNLISHSSKDFDNADLPLQIADQLVYRMGGKITMQSSEGTGIVVWLLLPCQPKEMTLKL